MFSSFLLMITRLGTLQLVPASSAACIEEYLAFYDDPFSYFYYLSDNYLLLVRPWLVFYEAGPAHH